MKVLYVDLKNGLSGDIFLAGLAGLGLNLEPFAERLKDTGLIKALSTGYENRHGFKGMRLYIEEAEEQPLRTLTELLDAVRKLGLSDTVWGKCRRAFVRLAEAEALAHGIAMDDVHFHEIGAVDTIIDVAGAFWGLEQIGIDEVRMSHIPWFSGHANTEHGQIDLPSPAALRLLEGKPFSGNGGNWEIITPTGALLIDCLTSEFINEPSGMLMGHSLAFGTNQKGRGVRLFLFDLQAEAGTCSMLEQVWVLESHIDHLSGEEMGLVFTALMDEGALDVLYLPGIMKKNRPGGVLRVICAKDQLDKLENAFFRHTHTLGIRRRLEERKIIPRQSRQLISPHLSATPLTAKTYVVDGQEYTKPELDALEALARKTNRTVVQLKAMMYDED